MNRILAWLLFLVVLLVAVKGCAAYQNPWSKAMDTGSRLLYIPGCGEKPECRL